MSEPSRSQEIGTTDQKALLLDITVLVFLIVIASQIVAQTFKFLRDKATLFGGTSERFVHIDFINTYMMSKLALSKASHMIYDPQTQFDCYNQVIAPAKVNAFCFCQYPPFYFPLFAPLTLFSLQQAFMLWNAFAVVSGSIGVFLITCVARRLSLIGALTLIALSIASFPSCDSILNGEITWFFFALFCLFSFLFMRGNYLAAGIPLGLLSLKPHFFVVALVPALLSRRSTLASAAAVVVLLLGLAAYFVGFENIINYPNILLHAESSNITSNLYPERMVCLRGPLSIFSPRPVALAVSLLGFVLGMALTCYLWFKALIRKQLSVEWAMSLSILLLLITSPHMHVYDSVLVYLPAVLTLPSVRLSQLLKARPLAFRAWSLLLFSYAILSWLLMWAIPLGARAVLPLDLQNLTAVNGIKCGLLGFYAYLCLHALLLALGLRCALGNRPPLAKEGTKDS